jgi:hypothetical protein
MKYPEAGMTLGVGLALVVPGIGVVIWKLYLPKLASAPWPGTEKIGISSNPLERGVNVIVSWTPPGVVITRFDGTDVLSPEKHRSCLTNLWIIKTLPELPAAGVIHVGGCSELPNRPAITEFGRYGLVPDVEVTGWDWFGDPEVAAELSALVESDGAVLPFKTLAPAQPARVMLATHTAASAPVADRQAIW